MELESMPISSVHGAEHVIIRLVHSWRLYDI
jgi:hypothetical protein